MRARAACLTGIGLVFVRRRPNGGSVYRFLFNIESGGGVAEVEPALIFLRWVVIWVEEDIIRIGSPTITQHQPTLPQPFIGLIS